MKDLLARLGHSPHHEKNGELWYLSPFREETEPSFKLTMNSKGWYDHGRGEGGNILDFAIALGQVNGVGEALRWLEREWNSSRPLPLFSRSISSALPKTSARQSALPINDGPPIAVEKMQPLEHPALIGYLRSRGIAPDLARPYVQEIHYTRDGKHYFALAFANGSGGHELRNPYFKGTYGTKDITTLEIGQQTTQEAPTAVFEGFFDFLTAVAVNSLPGPPVRVLVLNSTSMTDRALDKLREWGGSVHLFLDNDTTGREHSAYFHAQLRDRQVIDHSDLYAEHNDFNAMLAARQTRTR